MCMSAVRAWAHFWQFQIGDSKHLGIKEVSQPVNSDVVPFSCPPVVVGRCPSMSQCHCLLILSLWVAGQLLCGGVCTHRQQQFIHVCLIIVDMDIDKSAFKSIRTVHMSKNSHFCTWFYRAPRYNLVLVVYSKDVVGLVGRYYFTIVLPWTIPSQFILIIILLANIRSWSFVSEPYFCLQI